MDSSRSLNVDGRHLSAACGLLFVGLFATTVQAQPRVPGLNELVVLDPGVHETGLPAVLVEDGQVEIPPTLHVHRYYYSGDKEFQAPILNGGPTIVVAKHPKTGKQAYIDVVLPAGAPLVAHTEHSITYVYTDRRVVVKFSHLLPKCIVVKNVRGRGLGREIRENTAELKADVREASRRSRFLNDVKDVARGTGEVAKGAVGAASAAGSYVVSRVGAGVAILPGIQQLRSLGQQADERAAQEELREAGGRQFRDATRFLPTNR